jgi:DNA-directed RNA polymerase subunit RPC12/RpoP
MDEKEIRNIESTIKAESNMYNQGTKSAQLIHEIVNSAYNHKPIIDKIKSGQARDISDSVKITGNKNCFILGSGPSLDDSIQYLKDWEGGIFCTPSHALSLMYYGIEPTYILILDPFEQWGDLSGVDWSKTKTKLITHPGCYVDLIENWPNEILLYLENAAKPDSFYQDEQQKMYSWRTGDFRKSTFNFYIRTAITIFACSPPMEMFAAEILGYEKFFLAGCDFAYHSDKQRFTDYTIKEASKISDEIIELSNRFNVPIDKNYNNIEWEKHEHPFNPDNPNLVKTNSGLLSESIHIYYLKNLMSAWRLCGKTVYTTDHGAMIQVPYHDIKAVIKKQGDFPLQHRPFINKICDAYLASTGAYAIETNHGVLFVESMDYEKELPLFMVDIMKRYHCATCGASMNSNDSLPHDGDDCPNCHKGKIQRSVNIDSEMNMNRIRESIKRYKNGL